MTRNLKQFIGVLTFFTMTATLGGCASFGLNEMNTKLCPPVDILATADSLPMGNKRAALQNASLKCFIKNGEENALTAQVTVSGRANAGAKLPIFIAALDRDDKIIARTQYKLTARDMRFTLTLPPFFAYGRKGDDTKPRLVVGFILNDQQLADNRALYGKQLGLVD